MITAILKYLFSQSKWAKIWLLAREKIDGILYVAWKLTGIGNGDFKGIDNMVGDTSVAIRGEQRINPNSDFKTAPCKWKWHYKSQLNISEDVLHNAAIEYAQDYRASSGDLSAEFEYNIEEVVGASIVSNGATHVSVYDSKNNSIPEFCYVKYNRANRKVANANRQLPIRQFVPGLTVNLYGNIENAAGNYGHWMVDGIGALFLVLQRYSIESIDHFLVPTLRYDFMRDSLIALGIPPQKIIELPVLSCFQFERLMCTSAPRGYSSCITPGWLIDGYRKTILETPKINKPKRLYISRRDANSRKFVNEDEIIHLLERHGFVSVELSDYSFEDKVSLFRNAEFIVGLTGAGLTNIMFCSAGTKVLELFPTSYVTYFYASIAAHLGLNYRPLIFKNHSALSRVNKYYGNLSLNPNLLEKSLSALL